MEPTDGKKKAAAIVRRLLLALLMLAMAALFYITVILIRPAREDEEPPAPTPLPMAEAPRDLAAEEELPSLIAAFPAPVLVSRSMTLRGGRLEDIPWSQGYARQLTLVYADSAGRAVTAVSLWPAAAGGILLDSAAHPEPEPERLAGMTAALLRGPAGAALLAQTDEAAYRLAGEGTAEELMADAADAVRMIAP